MAGSSSDSVAVDPSVAKIYHDLRVSLGLLIGGVPILAGALVLEIWMGAFGPGSSSSSGVPPTFPLLLAGTGGVFVLIGGSFAVVNWLLLRRRGALPARGSPGSPVINK
jgi:hypothetical protein